MFSLPLSMKILWIKGIFIITFDYWIASYFCYVGLHYPKDHAPCFEDVSDKEAWYQKKKAKQHSLLFLWR